MSDTELYKTILKDSALSNTRARAIVFEILLSKQHKPVTMAELIASTGQKIDRASVYRTVELFEEVGIIKRIYVGWKYKLELSDRFQVHHHHITCSKCSETISVQSTELEKLLRDISAKHGYKLSEHQLEASGLCQRCQLTIVAP